MLVFSASLYYNDAIGGAWCSGSTRASDSLSVGSIPIAPAKISLLQARFFYAVDLPTNLRYNNLMAIQTKQPAKWRETADPFSFDFNNFKLIEVLGYPHAGNDVFFVKGIFDEKEVYAFIKSKRHVDANLENEVFIINSLPLSNVPKVLDYDGKDFSFCVLSAMDGQRLSVLVGDNADNRSLDYMFEYGKTLASLHKSKIDGLKEVKWRRFFDIPSDEFLAEYGLDFVKDFLVKNKPSKINQCFVHGDFHYANLLWENG
ncbi:MAG: aminoglycoside phosphotransferase family protein, partial [Clostridia bacterium]|nr:aminoglycoside phosphotransferase family protein [Clostridia bacterium]